MKLKIKVQHIGGEIDEIETRILPKYIFPEDDIIGNIEGQISQRRVLNIQDGQGKTILIPAHDIMRVEIVEIEEKPTKIQVREK